MLISGEIISCKMLVFSKRPTFDLLFKEAVVCSDSLYQFHERSVSKELLTSMLENVRDA